MIKPGFVIKKLQLTGYGQKPAIIQLEKGLNLITGPSDCGKSYIFQCINYMLGASTIPKQIPEAKYYEDALLEIFDYQGNPYTLQRSIKGGNFRLYETEIKNISEASEFKTLGSKHDSDDENTVSAFFLKLNKLYNKKVRTNARGATRSVSYRDIIKFLMVSETRITTEDSVIHTDSIINKTVESNIFKLITTGRDDSGVIAILPKKEKDKRTGKVELLDEIITEIDNELTNEEANLSTEEIKKNIEKLDKSFSELKNRYSKLNVQFKVLEEKRNLELSKIRVKQSREKVLNELYKRSSLLKNQYETDISRLKSTIETSTLLLGNHTFNNECPLCKNKIKEKCKDDQVNKIIDSCEFEIRKIVSLLNELIQSEKVILNETEELKIAIDEIQNSIDNYSNEINEGVGKEIDEIISLMQKMTQKRSRLNDILNLKNRYKKFLDQRNQVHSSIPKSNAKAEFDSISTSSLTDFCNYYKKVLEGINFPELTSVSFSEENNDFVISGNDRKLSGKGIRAIVYACFIVTVNEYINDKKYSLGVPVLDSPLVTYKKRNANSEEIPVDLAMDFYRYISRNKNITQFIIIENEDPPNDIKNNINHIEFGSSPNSIRKGFIPE